MEVIKQISQTLGNVLSSYFSSDMEVMSDQAKRIFSNEQDRKTYVEAIEKLYKNGEKEERITLSTGETITLLS